VRRPISLLILVASLSTGCLDDNQSPLPGALDPCQGVTVWSCSAGNDWDETPPGCPFDCRPELPRPQDCASPSAVAWCPCDGSTACLICEGTCEP
jgi:hypothetical protein